MIAFLAWLVQKDIFKEAGFFCMLKGHTFSLLDQSFSTLITSLKYYAVYTISSLVLTIHKLLAPYNVVDMRELHCLWDFKVWLEPHVNNFGGFATGQFGDGMHEFLIRKDGEGVVRIFFRKSSQSSTWIPEGMGYEVFKSIPEDLPPPAAIKPDQSWERHTVESAVRKWLPHFSLPTAEAFDAAKEEWNKRLWRMPANLQVDDLPESEKLVWPIFPQRHEVARAAVSARSVQN
eukprot:3714121-Pleurochrysis_carterae.AAC.1